MATKKKAVTKKVSAKPPVKVAKKTTTRATKVSKSPKKVASFKVAKERVPFSSIKVTEQTLYWGILFLYIFALSLWVLSIQLNILNIINSISATI